MNPLRTAAFSVFLMLILGLVLGYGYLRDLEPAPIIAMEIASSAFLNDETIPAKYTCDVAAPVSPPLFYTGFPDGTQTLALVMEDVDVPTALRPEGIFDHWVMFNIPTATTTLEEGKNMGTIGANSRGGWSYAPPCPPPQYEPAEHRYKFTLYALDATLDLKQGATKAQLLTAMEGHILEVAQLTGRYARPAQ